MNRSNTSLYVLVTMIGATVLALSDIAEAKGYSPVTGANATERQRIERRLSQIEDRQQQLERALTAELRRLQAELKEAQVEQLAKSAAPAGE